MFDVSILVLVYGKEINESKTLSSLSKLDFEHTNAQLVIWNNGPSHFNGLDFSGDLDIFNRMVVETIDNISIAKIYNSFINEFSAKKYIILDDDSELNSDYIYGCLRVDDYEIGLPLLTHNGDVVQPTINGTPVDLDTPIGKDTFPITVGSGIVLGSGAIASLNNKFGQVFDERFKLYGVDTSFCFRVNSLKKILSIKLLPGFEHSFSRLSNEKINKFKRHDRGNSLGLLVRYYSDNYGGKFAFFIMMIKLMKWKCIDNISESSVRAYILSYITGKYYQ